MDYQQLRPYASPRQHEILDALETSGSQAEAATKLDIHVRNVERALQSLRTKAALQEPSEQLGDMTKTVPDPFRLRGTSTLYGKDGKVKQAWVKTEINRDQIAESLKLLCEELSEDVRGNATPVGINPVSEDDLMTVYPMGDPHLGMYAWAEECGEDFDVYIAEKDIAAAMSRLIEASPHSKRAVILNLGDFFHADNQSNMTSRSGAVLDVDTRWTHIMRAGARLMIKMIKLALLKHREVTVRNVRGNHDDHSSMALSMILDAYFDEEPRVLIETSPAEHWYIQHGKVLIGSTHGDKAKMKDLPGVMACDRAEAWGDTLYRYWYCGHIHHSEVHEGYGAIVEYFRTLAGKDAWHTGMGYRAGRDMRCIVHHSEFGEIERHTVDLRLVRSNVRVR